MSLKKQWEFCKSALIDPIVGNTSLLIFGAGVAAIFAAKYYKVALTPSYAELLAQLGWAMLGAGVFATILKSGQFSDLFQKHIADVIYNPARAENQKILPEKWRLLTDARIKELLPSSYSTAVAGIEKRFFDDELDYHFESFEIVYSIVVTDSTVVITNTMDTTLRIPKHVKDPVFKQKIRGDQPARLTAIFINNRKIDLTDKTLFTGKGESRELVLNLRKYAKGADSVELVRTFVMTQNLLAEPYITAVISRFIKGAVIKGLISPSHKLRFIGMGISLVEPETIDGNGYTTWCLAGSDDLLLPGQGYMIVIISA